MKTVDSFWAKVEKKGPKDCWLWNASKIWNGYGAFWDGEKNVRAHRFSWSLENGKIKSGLCVLHRCDIRLCVNPSHLFLGTRLDNAQDSIKKGRFITPKRIANYARGVRNPAAKLDESKVIKMRELRKAGLSIREIAKKFGVTFSPARHAISGINWKHVPHAYRQAFPEKEGK